MESSQRPRGKREANIPVPLNGNLRFSKRKQKFGNDCLGQTTCSAKGSRRLLRGAIQILEVTYYFLLSHESFNPRTSSFPVRANIFHQTVLVVFVNKLINYFFTIHFKLRRSFSRWVEDAGVRCFTLLHYSLGAAQTPALDQYKCCPQ
jgi:hypothetical protein